MDKLVAGEMPSVEDIYVGRKFPAKCRTAETVRFFTVLNEHLWKHVPGYRSRYEIMKKLHLTLLEPLSKTASTDITTSYELADIYKFGDDLYEYLGGPDHTVPIDINPDSPLIWVGVNSNKLAINLLPETSLMEDHARAGGFAFGYFGGHLPELQPFIPHITIGSFAVEDVLYDNPNNLLPPELSLPASLSVGGLRVCVNNMRALRVNYPSSMPMAA